MSLKAEAARQRARIEGMERATKALSTPEGAIDCVLSMSQPEQALAFLICTIFNGDSGLRSALSITEFWVEAKGEEAMQSVDLTEFYDDVSGL
ncbi:MAG TPA: hypothetical protein PLQ34_09970 [Ferrovaceae bacterium]|nr:hypothetical protein [Ferrovaceae bacterium]